MIGVDAWVLIPGDRIAGLSLTRDYCPMPLQWTISHPKRLVVAVAKGEMRPGTMIDFLAKLDAEGARPYAKLIFLEQLITTFSEESVVALANLVRKREEESVVGPIAIITRDDATFEQASHFAEVAELVRPIRVFREWHEARRWIDAVAVDPKNATA
jgi:hypothetical protein